MTHRRNLILILIVVAGCTKAEGKRPAEVVVAPEADTTPAPRPPPAPAATVPADPLDHVPRPPEHEEGCKDPLDAADLAFQEAYLSLCESVMPNLSQCYRDQAFLSAIDPLHSGLGRKQIRALFHELVSTEELRQDTCGTLARDHFCTIQAQTFSNAYTAKELRAAEEPEDCKALARALPGVLMYRGE